jgi:superfamily II DNA or RNA helicase
MSQKDLKESESKNILLGTYTMVSEGFDVPTLNTLVLASPISSIEQSIGRIQRQKEVDRKYIPIVIDFWDNYSLFKNQGFKRHTFYKKNGYDVQIKNIGTPVMHFEETKKKKDKDTQKVTILLDSDGES